MNTSMNPEGNPKPARNDPNTFHRQMFTVTSTFPPMPKRCQVRFKLMEQFTKPRTTKFGVGGGRKSCSTSDLGLSARPLLARRSPPRETFTRREHNSGLLLSVRTESRSLGSREKEPATQRARDRAEEWTAKTEVRWGSAGAEEKAATGWEGGREKVEVGSLLRRTEKTERTRDPRAAGRPGPAGRGSGKAPGRAAPCQLT